MKADREQIERLLKTARGQLDGILRMVEEDRYCIDIINQLLATGALLGKARNQILSAHLASCVKQAFEQGEETAAHEKMEELIRVVERLTK